MKTFVKSQWAKSERSLTAAITVIDCDPDSAASRAYYAAFHALTALLAERGKFYSKHSALRAALHRDLIQLGIVPGDVGKHFDFLLELREMADYGGVVEASVTTASQAIARSRHIIDLLRASSQQLIDE